MSQPVWQRRLVLAGKIGLAAGLVYWLVRSGRLRLDQLANVTFGWDFVALAGCVAGSMLVPAVRWWWLLRIQGLRESLGKIVSLTWAGYFAALLLPGAASGDVAKSYMILRRRDDGRARAFSTVLADRFLGLQSLFFLGAASGIALFLQNGGQAAWNMTAITILALGAMTFVLAALLFAPTRRPLLRLVPLKWRTAWEHSFEDYLRGWPALVGCFGLSIVSSALTIAALVYAGRVIGQAVGWKEAFLAGPLVIVANCLPLTPGGVGVAESASSELFGRLGSAAGAEMMLLTRLVTALLSLPGVAGVLVQNNPQPGRPSPGEPESAGVARRNPAIGRSVATGPGCEHSV